MGSNASGFRGLKTPDGRRQHRVGNQNAPFHPGSFRLIGCGGEYLTPWEDDSSTPVMLVAFQVVSRLSRPKILDLSDRQYAG